MTPLEVKEQRRWEKKMQMQEKEKQVSTITDLLKKATQLWTIMEEDP
jgi:hypothetical protein